MNLSACYYAGLRKSDNSYMTLRLLYPQKESCPVPWDVKIVRLAKLHSSSMLTITDDTDSSSRAAKLLPEMRTAYVSFEAQNEPELTLDQSFHCAWMSERSGKSSNCESIPLAA